MSAGDASVLDTLARAGKVGHRGLWSDALRRLGHDKLAVGGGAFILILIIAGIFAPLLSPYRPDSIVAMPYLPPFWSAGHDATHLLGTDSAGSDEMSQILYALRVSLLIGIIPATLITIVGVAIGLSSGWLGGRWDNLLMRLADAVYAFPPLLFFIIVQFVFRDTAVGRFGYAIALISAALAIVGWVNMARLVRGRTLVVRRAEFVGAARAVGVPTPRLLLRHVLPNVLSTVIVAVTFEIPNAILAEAFLSIVGLGVRPPASSLGSIIFDNFDAATSNPFLVLLPATAITLIAVSFTLLGDGLQKSLDPRLAR